VIKNSTELLINAPKDAAHAHIYSDDMITMESYTLTTGVQKTLKCIPFNPTKKEYIKLSNSIRINTPEISICFWIYLNDSLGSNNAIFDFTNKGNNTKYYNNRIAVKTKAKENKIAFMVNNSTVLVSISPQKWTHFCWCLKSDETNQNFEHWKITVNGEKDSAISMENKVAFNKSLELNNNLIGKSDSESELSTFNGKLTGITIYDKEIDANLDIHIDDDPTAKYLANSEGFVGMVGEDTYHNNLYDSGGIAMDFAETVSDVDDGLMDGLCVSASGDNENNLYDLQTTPTHFYPSIDYENMGLGIFFICMTIIIYRYF
jgi:hypothetical protein